MNRNLETFDQKYGSVKYQGQTIVLAEQAYETGRLLTEYPDCQQYQGDGKTYMTEWQALGYRLNGTPVRVRWHFEILRKTQDDFDEPQPLSQAPYLSDTEPEYYDWDNVYDVMDDVDAQTLPRDYTLRVRLTQSERAQLQDQAEQAGMDMSEYVRGKLF